MPNQTKGGVPMSFEAISKIAQAEAEAKALVAKGDDNPQSCISFSIVLSFDEQQAANSEDKRDPDQDPPDQLTPVR